MPVGRKKESVGSNHLNRWSAAKLYRRPFQHWFNHATRTNYFAAHYYIYRTRERLEGFKGLALICLLWGICLLLKSSAGAQVRPIRRVLILNETGTSYRSVNVVDQGIRTALESAPYKIEFYREYMETVLFPDPATQQEFRDFYVHKYKNRQPDVIITAGPSPLKFMLEAHQRAFPGVPVVFCLTQGLLPDTPKLDDSFTGVVNDLDPGSTLYA